MPCSVYLAIFQLIKAKSDAYMDRRQGIIWTKAVVLLMWNLGTNFSDILSNIHTFSFKKIHLKTSSVKWCPFCLGLNEFMINISQLTLCRRVISIYIGLWESVYLGYLIRKPLLTQRISEKKPTSLNLFTVSVFVLEQIKNGAKPLSEPMKEYC